LETTSPSIGQALLLPDYIGEHEAAAVVRAIEKSIRDGVVTNDMGRTAGTAKVGSYITESVRKWKVGILG
jgi:3-isopropylmalate dehydrogenase